MVGLKLRELQALSGSLCGPTGTDTFSHTSATRLSLTRTLQAAVGPPAEARCDEGAIEFPAVWKLGRASQARKVLREHGRFKAYCYPAPGYFNMLSKVRTRASVHHVYYHSLVLPGSQWTYFLRCGAVMARSSPAAREECQLGAGVVRPAGRGLQMRETAGHSKVCTCSREHRRHCHSLVLPRSQWT